VTGGRQGKRTRAGWRWLGSTALLSALWFAFFAAHLRAWANDHRPVGLGVVLLEAVFAVLFLFRRQALTVSRAPLAWAAAALGSFGMIAVRPSYEPIGSEALALALQLGGSIAAGISLVALGRSFGVVAANRGLRTGGAYAIVRHPVYACYLLTAAGYLLENPTRWNAFVVAVFIAAQLLRIREEESCLAGDPAYASYRAQVRYRLVPYVF
jgi:protein-S-isoprenylcysteine O-methyltransferase Ste14